MLALGWPQLIPLASDRPPPCHPAIRSADFLLRGPRKFVGASGERLESPALLLARLWGMAKLLHGAQPAAQHLVALMSEVMMSAAAEFDVVARMGSEAR